VSIDNVLDLSPRQQYTASVGQTVFPYPFAIFADADLVVYKGTVLQALNTDYTVSGATDDNGGNVTFVVPMTGGEVVTIYRDIAIARTTDFQQNGPNLSTSMNDELDRITLVQQQLENQIGRALRIPQTAAPSNASLELTPIANWLSKYVFIGPTGVPEPAAGVSNVTLTQSVIGALLFPITAAEISAGVTPTNFQYEPGKFRRYGVTGSGNEATAIQNALNCGEKVIDGEWIACTSNSALTVPAGVELKNINITAGAAGINLLLLNTGCKVSGKLTGKGTVSQVERLIYPAAQGVTDVTLDVEVSNATYGVHLQPTSGTAVADRPKRWKGRIYAHDIVGTAGVDEGYALLMSPAEQCDLILIARNIARHALYLSAGSRYNKVVAHVDDCDNYAAQIYSTSAQDATEQNEVTLFCQNLDETVAGQGGAVAIVQKAHRNTVRVFHDGDGMTTESVRVEGASGGPYPTGNKIVNGAITGQFTGTDVIRMLNADGTIVSGNTLHAYATSCVIGMRRTGTNGSSHGGFVEGNEIDGQGQNVKGIYNEINSQASYVGPNEIFNNSSGARVDDQTSGKREGYSRSARVSGTTASITAASTGDTSATLSRSIATTRRKTVVNLTGASVSYTAPSQVIGTQSPADDTHVGFRIYNAHGADQTFNYDAFVEGD